MCLLDQIDKQIDVHLRFMDSMEQIRWRFTSAFGITALVGLLFVSAKLGNGGLSKLETVAAYFIVAVISISGLMTQIRIIGLFWSQWHRIRELQLEKIKILEAGGTEISNAVKTIWCLPHIVPSENRDSLYFTVHEANCLLFSLFLSISVALTVNVLYQNSYLTGALILIGTLVLTYSGHRVGRYYYNKVVSHG